MWGRSPKACPPTFHRQTDGLIIGYVKIELEKMEKIVKSGENEQFSTGTNMYALGGLV